MRWFMRFKISMALLCLSLASGCASYQEQTKGTTLESIVNSNASFKEDGARLPASPDDQLFEGCFQLYTTGSMAPAFCLGGVYEEGIGGGNVRMYMFGTNTDDLVVCSKSSTAGYTNDSMTFDTNEGRQLTIKDMKKDRGGVFSGTATVGRTILSVSKLSQKYQDKLYKVINASRECDDVNVGEMKVLRNPRR